MVSLRSLPALAVAASAAVARAQGADGGLARPAVDWELQGLAVVAEPDGGAPPRPDSSGPGGDVADAGAAPTGPDLSKLRFDADGVRAVVKWHMPGIQACYERVLAEAGTKIEGRITVRFLVNPDGTVKEARVYPRATSLKNESVQDCVLSSVHAWIFPKADDGRIHPIEYPFDLKYVQ